MIGIEAIIIFVAIVIVLFAIAMKAISSGPSTAEMFLGR